MAPSTVSSGGRITCPLVVIILSVCLGSNFQFYSNSVINNVASIGQEWINGSFHAHYGVYVPSESAMSLLWSFSSAALQIGCLIGAAFVGFLADRYGRRKALMIISTAGMAGSLLNGVAKPVNSFELFIIGRVFLGLCLGSGLPLASIFISEIAPVRYRGACGSAQQIAVGFGNVVSLVLTLSQLLGTETLWPIAASVPTFLAALLQFLMLFFYAHDSPRYLVLCDQRYDKGLAALKFYQGEKGAETRLEGIKNEKTALEKEGQNERKLRFVDLFRKSKTRRPLIISLLILFGVQMSGVSAVLAYSKSMFQQAGIDGSLSEYATVGIGLCNCLSPFLTLFLAERAGRKLILLTGLSIVDAALITLTICLIGSNHYGWTGAEIGAIPCLYIYQIGFALSVSIAMIAPAELFPQKARAPAIAVVFSFSWILQIVCTLCYLPFAHLVGSAYSYLPFIASVSFSLVLLAVLMPETKGRTVESIAALFAKDKVHCSSPCQESHYVTRF